MKYVSYKIFTQTKILSPLDETANSMWLFSQRTRPPNKIDEIDWSETEF